MKTNTKPINHIPNNNQHLNPSNELDYCNMYIDEVEVEVPPPQKL